MNNASLNFKNIFEIIDDYDAFLFDLWGVIVEGTELYPNVVGNINKIIDYQNGAKKVFFVSNAPRPSRVSLEKIKSWGIKAKESSVMTSGEIARSLLQNQRLKPVIYHLGADRNFDILQELDYQVTNDIGEANILLLTLYRDAGENLREFDELLKTAAQLGTINICANPDTIIPNQGVNRYCPGYFAATLERYGAEVIYTGKPYKPIYEEVFKQIADIPKHRILMIGDTLETDILGAQNSGIHSALVLSGNAEKFHRNDDSLQAKLESLRKAASSAEVMPNFVTSLTDI